MSYMVSEVYEAFISAPVRRRARGGVRFIAAVTVVLLASLLTLAVEGQGRVQQPSAQADGELPVKAVRQIEALVAEKAHRTAAQRKVSSQLLAAWRVAVAHRRAEGADTAAEMVTVDIRADVTPEVLARIRDLGGTVINSVPRYRAIRARLPLAAMERLAALDAIQSIRAADKVDTPG